MSALEEPLHEPVLADEVVSCLAPSPSDYILDCTFGSGGHAELLSKRLGSKGGYVALDWDAEHLRNVPFRPENRSCEFVFRNVNFADAREILDDLEIMNVDGVLADLGWSTDQLRTRGKGLSFEQDEFLDMRFHPDAEQTAADLVHSSSQERLTELFRTHGEHRFGRQIAKKIVDRRERQPIRRTLDLLDLIASVTGKHRRNETAARIFQALRVEVNNELENLEQLLEQLPKLLSGGGRACVISFHSLEDRRVKSSFRKGMENGYYRELVDGPVQPDREEVRNNVSARSAKLRAVEYTGE